MVSETPQNAELRRKWKIKSGNTLFALRTSISKEYIEHVRDSTSPMEVWETLEKLSTRRNTSRLQYLENELAMTTQSTLSIEEYSLKVKNLCSEISKLNKEEKPLKDASLRHYLIHGLRKEFMPFISSVQGWATQPFIIELENLLSNQEALTKQAASSNNQAFKENVFYTKEQSRSSFTKNSTSDQKHYADEEKQRSSSRACIRCGKP